MQMDTKGLYRQAHYQSDKENKYRRSAQSLLRNADHLPANKMIAARDERCMQGAWKYKFGADTLMVTR